MIIELIGVLITGAVTCGILLAVVLGFGMDYISPWWIFIIIPVLSFGVPLSNIIWVARLERRRSSSIT